MRLAQPTGITHQPATSGRAMNHPAHASRGLPLVREHVLLFLDTEFSSFEDREPLSIGIVGAGGRQFYAEIEDADMHAVSTFVADQVQPLLRAPGALVASRQTIAALLREWLKPYAGMSVVLVHDYFADLDIALDLLSAEAGAGAGGDYPRERLKRLAADLGLAELVPMDVSPRLNEQDLDAWFTANPQAERHHALNDSRALAHAFKQSLPAGLAKNAH